MQKVMVTGATGFIGAAICAALEEADYSVLPLGRGTLQRQEVDVLVHAAGRIPGPGVTSQDFQRDNVVYLKDVVNALNCSRVILLSTAAVYGDAAAPDVWVKEDYSGSGLNDYAASKLAAEHWLRERGLDTLVLRLPVVLGSGSANYFLMNAFRALKDRQAIMLYGGNLPYNNLIDMQSLTEFMQYAVQNPLPGYQVLNVVPDGALSLANILAFWAEQLGVEATIEEKTGNGGVRLLSNRQLHKLFRDYDVPDITGVVQKAFILMNEGAIA